jgi:WD40 repeat protein
VKEVSPPPSPESEESLEQRKARLELKKLELEIRDLSRPFWQRVLDNPQFITASITTIGAIIAGWLLINNNYFENRRQQLNAEIAASKLEADSSKKEAATAKLEASQAELTAKQSTDDAEAKTTTAKALTEKANREMADADKKEREAKVKLDSLGLALDSEDVLSEIRDEHAPGQFPLAKLDQARSLAWSAWRNGQSKQAGHAVVLAYARPTDLLHGRYGGISDAKFSSDGKLVITSGGLDGDGGVYLWRIADGKFRLEKDGKPSLERLATSPYSSAYDPILSPDQRFAVSLFRIGFDGELRIWQREKDGLSPSWSMRDFPAADPRPPNLNPPVFSKENLLAFEGLDGIVQVWNALVPNQPPVSMRDCQGEPNTGTGFRFSPDGGLLAVAHIGGNVHFCDPKTGTQGMEPIAPGKDDKTKLLLNGVDFSLDGNRLLLVSPSSEIWNLSTLRHCVLPGAAGKAVFSHDSKSQYVFSIRHGSEKGVPLRQAIAWSGETCEFRKVLEHDGATDIQLSPDGSRAIILADNSMDIFDANSLEKLSSLEYECAKTKATISSDGSFVAAWGHCEEREQSPIFSIYTAVTEKEIGNFLPKE